MFVKSKNALLNIRVFSEEKAEAIILLHGGPGVPDKMEQVVGLLIKKYKVITFDQRGCGDSLCEKNDYSIESYIEDINNIANFFDLKKFHLFGFSWGGLYAQIYAKKNPDKLRSLFLCGAMPETNKNWRKAEREVAFFNMKQIDFKTKVKTVKFSLLGLLGINDAYKKMLQTLLPNYKRNNNGIKYDASTLKKVSAKLINKTRQNAIKYPKLEKVESPPFPIIITYGETDIYNKSQKYVFERFPTSEKIIIPNCGHTPWFQNPKEFKKIMIKFYNI